MRILFLANNWAGWKIAEWLQQQQDTTRGSGVGQDEIVGLVLHPNEKQRYAPEIKQCLNVDPVHIFDGSRLREPEVIEAIQALQPDIGISAFFGYILRPELLSLLNAGCINLHPALLPYNRGSYPNVWSIIEGTPAGVTLHYMDSGVDTGDIIAQRTVPVMSIDTGETLYQRLEQASVELFRETWPLIRIGQAPRQPQSSAEGTMHRVRDVDRIDEIDLDRSYTARELINILRARTFSPYQGAYFRDGQRKVYLRLQPYYGSDDS